MKPTPSWVGGGTQGGGRVMKPTPSWVGGGTQGGGRVMRYM